MLDVEANKESSIRSCKSQDKNIFSIFSIPTSNYAQYSKEIKCMAVLESAWIYLAHGKVHSYMR